MVLEKDSIADTSAYTGRRGREPGIKGQMGKKRVTAEVGAWGGGGRERIASPSLKQAQELHVTGRCSDVELCDSSRVQRGFRWSLLEKERRSLQQVEILRSCIQ